MGHGMSSETSQIDEDQRFPPTPPPPQLRRTDAPPQARDRPRFTSLHNLASETSLADGRDRFHSRRRELSTTIEDTHRLPPPSPARLRPAEIQEQVLRRLAERDRLNELRRVHPPPAEDEDDRSQSDDAASVQRSIRKKVPSPAHPSVS